MDGEVEVGLDRGLEEDHLAICLLGNDQAGSLVLAGDLADGGGAIHIIHGFAQGFHGFQDGGGRIRLIFTAILGTGVIHMQPILGPPIRCIALGTTCRILIIDEGGETQNVKKTEKI